MTPYKHLMLDLETWGTNPGCAIRSIGAVRFDFDGKPLGPAYYANVDTESCVDVGLQIDPRVVEWWGAQPAEAQAALDLNQLPITEALDGFLRFVVPANDVCVWSHGATFDIPILDHALRTVGRGAPWDFRNCRDTRTMIWMADQLDIVAELRRVGIQHQALDDAKTRALQMVQLYHDILLRP